MKTYNDIYGYFSFHRFYKYIGENYLKNGMKIVEIGAFQGKSTVYMASKIKERNLKVEFHAVDHWQGSSEHVAHEADKLVGLYDVFLKNIKECEVENYIIPLKEESTVAASKFPIGYFDFIFIDASHEYELVKKDIIAWAPRVKWGGIIGGDDYSEVWPGVVQAVNEFFGTNVKTDMIPAWYVKT